MRILHCLRRRLIVAALITLITPCVLSAADGSDFTKEQIENFLLTAKVIDAKNSSKGVTGTSRLTLSDGTITHDASFQSINENKASKQLTSGTELSFVDSYRYNIAAFRL